MRNYEILSSDREEQLIELMEDWFRSNFEDPVIRTPHDGEEGGYNFIWGGPYDAQEELENEFGYAVHERVIKDLAERLSAECAEWGPKERPGDYADWGLFEAVKSNVGAYETFGQALSTNADLLGVQMPIALQPHFRRLLYANAITVLETYLSDTFINRVLRSVALLQLYIDADRSFRERKLAYNDVLREAVKVESAVQTELLGIAWHNIGRVKAMYKAVLDVDLGEIGTIGKAIEKRHDIVHRNGRSKGGVAVVDVSNEDMHQLIRVIMALGSRVEDQLKPINDGPQIEEL